ncbi:hypothetical protein DSCO28_73350 (plasmid) [Desulfosarcina ovata subsp. sediminis]|uniref:Uncharacterized protein n=1 Tax=Desulfosarcina ovata subsp. sediminis TaxID=885957 RepID=A0A5K8A2L0_9BACT|nr:hypothetical protein [Desulfosarcina ovata]BBO86769.1 hypothetical protein DSCO28_73350 [Desulfosarcina ovata subsp. sediminis]
MKIRRIVSRLVVASFFSVCGYSPVWAYTCPYLVHDALSYQVKKEISKLIYRMCGDADDKTCGTLGLSMLLLEATLENQITASSALQNTATTITKGFEAHIQALRNLLVEQTVAERKIENYMDYGTPGRSPYASCDEESRVDVTMGRKNTAEASVMIRENIASFNTGFEDRKASMEAIRDLPEAATSAENIFPKDNTLQVDGDDEGTVTNAVRWVQIATNPYPDLTVQEELEETPSGKDYEAVKKIKEASLTLPQLALSDIIANKTPSHELGDWAEQMNAIMGQSGTPACVVDGKISADALLDMLTDLRYANPNWPIDIHSKSTVGILRELLLMRSVHLEFKRRQMVLLQHLSAMLATKTAKENNLSEELEQMRKKAMEERAKGG